MDIAIAATGAAEEPLEEGARLLCPRPPDDCWRDPTCGFPSVVDCGVVVAAAVARRYARETARMTVHKDYCVVAPDAAAIAADGSAPAIAAAADVAHASAASPSPRDRRRRRCNPRLLPDRIRRARDADCFPSPGCRRRKVAMADESPQIWRADREATRMSR